MIFENIQKHAKEQGLTIQSIEQKCGLSNGIISKWKENNNPKVENLQKVAAVLGVSIEELLSEE